MKDREDLGDFPRLASRSKAAPVTVEAQQKGPTTFYHLQGEGGLQPQGITLSSSTLIRCLELKTRNFNPILDPFYEKLQDKAEKDKANGGKRPRPDEGTLRRSSRHRHA